MNEIESRKVTI
uniref:Uncharacterized protein n=1 Tax=Arundo donax TaxID=35708 RepID=A0A0A9ESP2_ARUDO